MANYSPDDIGFDEELPPRRSKRGASGNVTAHPRVLDAERRAELRADLEHVRRQIDDIAGQEITTSQRIEKLLAVNSTIIVGLLREALGEYPDLDRAQVLGRALTAVKDTSSVLKAKHDMESIDTFNPRSPKFAIVFGWFIELVHKILGQHADEGVSTNFFNDLVTELSGWEDRIERQFKGISGRALASLQSPFVEGFRERVTITTAREQYLADLEGKIERAEARLHLLADEHTRLAQGGLDEVHD